MRRINRDILLQEKKDRPSFESGDEHEFQQPGPMALRSDAQQTQRTTKTKIALHHLFRSVLVILFSLSFTGFALNGLVPIFNPHNTE